MHPSNANIVLLASLENGVFRSTDGGNSWQRTSPAGVNNLNTVAFDPTNGAIAYAGTFEQGLYKSDNGGASFYASNSGLANNRVWVISVAPSNPATVYVGTSDGVFRSANHGASWQRAGLEGNEVRALAVDAQNANRVYAGAKDGRVWLTTNGGSGWQNASTGLPSPRYHLGAVAGRRLQPPPGRHIQRRLRSKPGRPSVYPHAHRHSDSNLDANGNASWRNLDNHRLRKLRGRVPQGRMAALRQLQRRGRVLLGETLLPAGHGQLQWLERWRRRQRQRAGVQR